MQRTNRRQGRQANRIATSILVAPVLAAFLTFGPGTGVSTASTVAGAGAGTSAIAGTSWAASVRSHLGMQNATPDQAPGARAVHPVTAWAQAVKARLEARAHSVAEAGRSALAWSERGMASWYGRDHSGRRTSSGDRFDPMQLTCAHPTLPLGTRVLVTSDSTGRSVVVTVNDRGPYGGRIVDLSRAAAARIGMLNSGTASVTLQQATPDMVEVAQAADDDTSAQAIAASDTGAGDEPAVSRSPRGRRHTHLAGR